MTFFCINFFAVSVWSSGLGCSRTRRQGCDGQNAWRWSQAGAEMCLWPVRQPCHSEVHRVYASKAHHVHLPELLREGQGPVHQRVRLPRDSGRFLIRSIIIVYQLVFCKIFPLQIFFSIEGSLFPNFFSKNFLLSNFFLWFSILNFFLKFFSLKFFSSKFSVFFFSKFFSWKNFLKSENDKKLTKIGKKNERLENWPYGAPPYGWP